VEEVKLLFFSMKSFLKNSNSLILFDLNKSSL
jgi:hypothetical protein